VAETDKTEYKFKAFISYSHADSEAADWLHRAIESYRIPKELRGAPGRDGPIPERLFPIFRDRVELSSSPNLSQAIRDALEASAYLIVICSPAAAKSRWVNQEVIEFIKLGRADRIHALIVDGEPSSEGEGGCFPPALHSKLGPDGDVIPDPSREVLAADLRPDADGKDDAKLKLIAGLLGIAFNSLRRREVAAARRRLLITQGIAAAMAILLLSVGLSVWAMLTFRQESDERQVPGIRVVYHETTLDLTGWHETTPDQIAGLQKMSSALSRDRYTVVKTQPQASNYVHTVGTSSGIPPEISCTHCTIKPRALDAASRTSHEFLVVFDISELPLETETTIEYETRYWNAFQAPDQWWTGLRVSSQTDEAKFTIIFPPLKTPDVQSIQFYYHDNSDHPLNSPKDVTFVKNQAGGVSSLIWMISHPSTDRSYRVRWNWNDLREGDRGSNGH
jgi:hypothetical protein